MNKIKKIIIIAVILLLVFCVWIIKNNQKKELKEDVINSAIDEVKEEVNVKEEVIHVHEEDVKVEKKENKNIKEDYSKEEVKQFKEIPKEEVEQDNDEIEIEEFKTINKETEKIEDIKETKNEEISIDKDDSNFNLVDNSVNLEMLKLYGLPIVIDFGSEGCMPCRQMKPILIELNNELRGKAIIKYIDVWEYPEAAEGFEFSLIPTQFFINKNGVVYKQHTGILTKDEIIEILKEMGME